LGCQKFTSSTRPSLAWSDRKSNQLRSVLAMNGSIASTMGLSNNK